MSAGSHQLTPIYTAKNHGKIPLIKSKYKHKITYARVFILCHDIYNNFIFNIVAFLFKFVVKVSYISIFFKYHISLLLYYMIIFLFLWQSRLSLTPRDPLVFVRRALAAL